MVQTAIDAICRLFGFLMVACLALMVLMVFGNVVLRYGFNSGITISEELSRWLFVWMTFMGAVIAVRTHAHLGTDTLISRLPPAGRKACFIAAHILMLGVCGLMLQGAWLQTRINAGTTSAVMEASMAWMYAAGVVFALLATLILLHELFLLATGRLSEADLIALRESDDMPHGTTSDATATKP
jgi:TRAP-type C4-dicarboxylate transport system permease small subunit